MRSTSAFSNRPHPRMTADQRTQVSALGSMAANMIGHNESPGYVLALLRDASGHSSLVATEVARNSTSIRNHLEDTYAPREGIWEPHHRHGIPHFDPADCWWDACLHYVDHPTASGTVPQMPGR